METHGIYRPTYSITKDFDWDEEIPNNKLLFEMTAKYGIPYFSNYVNSDMNPSDVRSMAILGDQVIVYKDNSGDIKRDIVKDLVSNWNKESNYSIMMNGEFVKVIDMFEVPYENYDTYVEIRLDNGILQPVSYDHKCMIIRNGEIIEELAQNITSSDFALLARKGYLGTNIGTYETGKVLGDNLIETLNTCNEEILSSIQDMYYDTSIEFRMGLYDSFIEQAEKHNHDYFVKTKNKSACLFISELFATIAKYFTFETDGEYAVLKVYEPEVYNEEYYKVPVKEVVQLDARSIDKVYNFTVDTKEHIYELPNGVITHQCPLHADEYVLVRDTNKPFSDYFYISRIENLYKWDDPEKIYDVILNGKIKEARLHKFDNLDFYKVTTVNGYEVTLSSNHLNLVLGDEVKQTSELTTEDYLPFNLTTIKGKGLTYDEGFMVGAYLTNGYISGDGEVVYSYNKHSRFSCINDIMKIASNRFGAYEKLHGTDKQDEDISVHIVSKYLRGLIDEYVSSYSCIKYLDPMCIRKSNEFRRGIIDGCLYINTNKVYVQDKWSLNSISALFESLGIPCKITTDNESYCVEPYDIDSELCDNNEYIKQNGYMWFKIKSIEPITNGGNIGYCFEVLNDEEPYFMLPCGLVTHNCRLNLDLRELRRKNGGYFGSGDNTGCYDEQTEVLTYNRGWIPFKSLTREDKLYTRNADGMIEIHNPDKLFKYEYNGDLIHFNNNEFDMLVTPNHNMAFIDKQSNKQDIVRADQFIGKNNPIPRLATNTKTGIDIISISEASYKWTSGVEEHTTVIPRIDVSADQFIRFIGVFLTNGMIESAELAKSYGYRIILHNVKHRNMKFVKSLLDSLPFSYYEKDGVFTISNKQLWDYIRENIGSSKYTLHIPRQVIENCSARQFKILLETIALDNNYINKLTKTYKVVSKHLADNIQEISVLCGYSTSNIETSEIITSQGVKRKLYTIKLQTKETYTIKQKDITREHYTGYVYCCEVQNHVILVRRNGKATWCGNSIGVVTINMPRLAYKSENEEDFYVRLEKLMDIAARSLHVKRKVVSDLLEQGLYPYTKRYLTNFNNHFSTIGLVGMNEACLNAKWIRDDIASENGYQFAQDVLDFMLKKAADYQEMYQGELYNIEASPVESTSFRFALHDIKDYPDIITAGDVENGSVYYTNSTNLPVGYTDDMFEAMDHQDKLQPKYNSGTVFHTFLGEKLPSWKSAMSLTKKITDNYKLPYISFSPTYSICPEHGYLTGEQWKCPKCGKTTEVYSRVTGYYRAVQNFNDGKQQEFKERKTYKFDSGFDFNEEEVVKADEQIQINPIQEPVIEDQEVKTIQTTEHKKPILVTTEYCPNCKIVKQYIAESNFDCDIVLASENINLVKELSITQAPTLVVFNDDGIVSMYNNASSIRKYIEENNK